MTPDDKPVGGIGNAGTHAPAPVPAAPAHSPWESHAFRLLFGLWVGANLCGWMHESTSGWLMASLQASPFEVGLLQALAAFPSFFLALPSGALADLVDRRKILLIAYVAATVVSFALGLLLLAGKLSTGVLLLAALAMGVTFSLRLPAYAALMQEVLPRAAVPRAIVWNGASMNASRIVGPAVVGVIMTWAAPAYAYLLNGVLFLGLTLVLIRWRRRRERASTLPSERFIGAIRVGLQFARQTPAMRAVLIRSFVYYFFAIVQFALLPVVVRDQLDGQPGTYTMLFGLFGLGAVGVAFSIGRLRERFSRDQVIAIAIGMQAIASLLFAFTTFKPLLAFGMILAGYGWMLVASIFSVTAQFALPAWVRGRGLAAVQMAFMGGGSLGSVFWGQVANTWSIPVAFQLALVGTLASLLLFKRYAISKLREEDFTPSSYWSVPEGTASVEHDEGPVQVVVEYLIDPKDEDAFTEVMQESRRMRLRTGAMSWSLFRDSAVPGRYIEQWVEESWLELLRHRDRLTVTELAVRDQKRAFHIGPNPPTMTYLIAHDFSQRHAEPGSTSV